MFVVGVDAVFSASDIIVENLDCVAASEGATALWTSRRELSCLLMREIDMLPFQVFYLDSRGNQTALPTT